MIDAIGAGAWGYVAVVLAAATPWLELLVVIPAGITAGLPAVPVGLLAFVGNAAPVLGIIGAWGWWTRRRAARRPDQPATADAGVPGDHEHRPKRQARAERVFARYGLPGLALIGPLVTGVHLATVIALGLRAPRTATAVWMTASLALWSAVVTAAAAAGLDLIVR
ncbi:MAG: small multi-drug export protein [Egibacteraceae bacterium]